MRPKRLSHAAILVSLGANAEVGAVLGVKASTVCHWKQRGIPAVYWPALERLAKLRGVALTIKDLEASSPSRVVRQLCAA